MSTNILALAFRPLRSRSPRAHRRLAEREREATVELVAHLAALDARPSLYARAGTARSSATAPMCSAVRGRRVQPHLRGARVSPLSGDPRPARLRCGVAHVRAYAAAAPHAGEPRGGAGQGLGQNPARDRGPDRGAGPAAGCADVGAQAAGSRTANIGSVPTPPGAPSVPLLAPPRPRPVIETTSPERYRVQFTIGKESHDRLRRLQAFSAAKSRTGTRARSSSVPFPSSSSKSRSRSSPPPRSRTALSVPERIRPAYRTRRVRPWSGRATSRTRSSAALGDATEASAVS
jgi:hypothetical protein